MWHFLYNIFIMPIELAIEFVFSLANGVFDNPGICIIAVSIVVNILVFPLYSRADAIQEIERNKQKSMEKWVKHIKKTFKGEEKVMMLNTYYRQQHYSPLYAIKGSLSLLFQIPFFMAAYHFLSNLDMLQGTSFLFLSDLGAPDGLLTIGSFTINLLPILMTIINIVSGMIYTKGFKFKEKFQLYGIAIIFLILLYNSPSGLVFYWTLNNLFSLFKNIFMKLIKNPKKVLRWVVAVCGTGLSAFVLLTYHSIGSRKKLFFIFVFIFCIAFLFSDPLKRLCRTVFNKAKGVLKPNLLSQKENTKCFILAEILLVLLLGMYIPAATIASSASDFVNPEYNPLYLVFNTLSIYFGLFLWIYVFYWLSSPRGKRVFLVIAWLFTIVGFTDYYFFGKSYGVVTSMLTFDNAVNFSIKTQIINAGIILAISLVGIIVISKFPKAVKRIFSILIAGVLVISTYNCVIIGKDINEYNAALEKNHAESVDDIKNVIPISKSGKNVVVLMLDRAISGYIPYIFNEKPELYDSFDGFTNYTNTLSFAGNTNMSVPSLFGGYDYTPAEINSRKDTSVLAEHDNSWLVLPTLFSNDGYKVTVCNPPNAGLEDDKGLSLFDINENVKAYELLGESDNENASVFSNYNNNIQQKHFFYYSLFKTFPSYFNPTFYDEGAYCSTDFSIPSSGFFDSYGVLDKLEDLTMITDNEDNTLLLMQNGITHDPIFFSVPDYEPSNNVAGLYSYYDTNGYFDLDGQEMNPQGLYPLSHYQTNLVALLTVAKWLDYLKQNDVYDNTRIIIVSDHGKPFEQFDYMKLSNGVDVEWYNPVMLVKDFNSHGKLETNDSFMTLADVPALSADGLIDDPVNPFTGNTIDYCGKDGGAVISTADNFDPYDNDGYSFKTDIGKWFSVSDNIFDVKNWKELPNPTE